jgi:DNA invertase Pin-like site-specific DNA recombinase
MSFRNYQEPKNGRVFKVIGVCRISTEHQDTRSLDDQKALYKSHLDRMLQGKYEYEIEFLASQGSGENLERKDYLQLCEMVGAGKHDVVIAEDLGRICRRLQAHLLCEEAEDTATRVIAINDAVDTAVEGWQPGAIFASFRHDMYNRDTSKRIRRSLQNRFMQGGVFQFTIFGYIKPHPGATDAEVTKDPAAEPVYEKWFSLLEQGASFQEVADWLNDEKVPLGKYCRSTRWSGTMVGRITRNPILKGIRRRNQRVTIRENRSGRHKTIPAPDAEKLYREVPHLAFIDKERFDRLNRKLHLENAMFKSSKRTNRTGLSKKDTRWPGQHLRCGICGRLYVFGGHGMKERMMCHGVRNRLCWNSMSVSGDEVALAVAEFVRKQIENLPDFDETWNAEYRAELEVQTVARCQDLKKLETELTNAQRRLQNLIDTAAQVGSSDALVEQIRFTQGNVGEIRDKISLLREAQILTPDLPTAEQIRLVGKEVFAELALDHPEFRRLMKKLVDCFYVLPYRLIGGGMVQPKVRFQVSLLHLLSDHQQLGLDQLVVDGLVDLTRSPQRVAMREQAVSLRQQGLKHSEIGVQLGITKTAVGYALKLHRLMEAQGITDPWQPVYRADEVKDYFPSIRHPRFKFTPLEGFEETKHFR